MSRVYVASSWRNAHQPKVVEALRNASCEVYDFKDSDGFHWSEVDPNWKDWASNIPEYLDGLSHPTACRGFERDMRALNWANVCVFVMPCGVSASLEAGYAVGRNKLTIGYIPELREPDLMLKMFNMITDDLDEVVRLARWSDEPVINHATVVKRVR